ncbi:MAG: hypothetical protein ACOYL6_04810 [Bacteriovoracaceae bacterium]
MNIQKRTQEHLNLLNKALSLTQEIAQKTTEGDLDVVVTLSENRERLVQLIFHLFTQIDRDLNILTAEEITPRLVQDLKMWQEHMNLLVDSINDLDEQIIDRLEQDKSGATAEIAQLFQTRENLKGYDLSSVKK